MKKILPLIILILSIGYISFAAISFCRKPEGEICKGVRLEIQDSLKTGYMTTKDITAMLAKSNLDPTGQPLDKVSLRAIEKHLKNSPLISSSECYKTINGVVVVEVTCRRPILRILSSNNDSYYLDKEGEIIEDIAKAVYIPVATGHITRKFAKKELLPLAQHLQDDDFWNAQIEQIHVTQQGEIELIPRVGNHTITLGRPGDYAHKLEKLQTFYEKGLNKVGWDRYSQINIGHGDQVIATKKEGY